jgi:hypothetical protein
MKKLSVCMKITLNLLASSSQHAIPHMWADDVATTSRTRMIGKALYSAFEVGM